MPLPKIDEEFLSRCKNGTKSVRGRDEGEASGGRNIHRLTEPVVLTKAAWFAASQLMMLLQQQPLIEIDNILWREYASDLSQY